MHENCDPARSVRAGTQSGELEGSSDGIIRFFGIPYAAPPIGGLRWRPPQTPPSWTGVRQAGAFGPDCPQPPNQFLRATRHDEDCLALNIWTPALDGKLPVLVWLPGGGFVGGSGSDARTDGTELAKKGIVVVTVNYRTGIFGFFAHPDLTTEGNGSSGNYGLLDQIAALQWVQDNIANFGGDPNKVTLGGVSAGSACVSLLMTTSFTNLFQRAILQSAGAMRPLATLAEAEADGKSVGPSLAPLREVSVEQLLRLAKYYTAKPRSLTKSRTLRPILDGSVVREQELSAYSAGRHTSMPVLVGSNYDEGSQLAKMLNIDSAEQYYSFLEREFGASDAKVAKLYPITTPSDILPALGALYGDTQFTYGAHALARACAKKGPTWRYLFCYKSKIGGTGPHHGEEVSFTFGQPSIARDIQLRPGEPEADAAAQTMSDLWIRFIAEGSPGSAWPRCDETGYPFLKIDRELSIGTTWRGHQLAFLDEFYAPIFATATTRSGVAATSVP